MTGLVPICLHEIIFGSVLGKGKGHECCLLYVPVGDDGLNPWERGVSRGSRHVGEMKEGWGSFFFFLQV